jgi:type II secretory pathway component PulL
MFQGKSVGIDIQPGLLRIAVAASQGGRTKILSLLEKEIPPSDDDEAEGAAEAIRAAMVEAGADDSACVACLPAASSINRLLSVPITDSAKIRQTLKFQLEPQIPYPVDQVISDFMAIRELEEGAEILAIAVTKESVSQRLQPLQSAGVDTQIITLDALALADFYITPFDFSEERVTAMLLVGAESSFLGFFVGEALIGYRSLSGLGTSDEGAVNGIAKELRRSLVGFQSSLDEGAEIGTLCVGGPHGVLLREYLSEEFREMPIRTVEFNERNLAEIPPDLSGLAEEFRLAIALARAGLETSAHTVNFMQEEYAPPSAFSRLLPHIKFSLAVLAIVFVAWFTGVWTQIYSQTRQLKTIREEMTGIFANTLPGITSADDAEQSVEDLRNTFRALRNYSAEYISPLVVLNEVFACAAPEGERLVLDEMKISGDQLIINGAADSFNNIDSFKKRIEDSSLFSDVDEKSRGNQRQEKLQFRFTANIAREPASGSGPNGGGGS